MTTPSDSAMTAIIPEARLAKIRETVADMNNGLDKDMWIKILAHADALSTERTKLAADLARAEKEAKRWEHLAMEAWKRADEAYNASITDNLNCRAAEAKSARLVEALRKLVQAARHKDDYYEAWRDADAEASMLAW